MKLRQGIKRKNYRNVDEWIDAIYEKNKSWIDKRIYDTYDNTPKEEIFRQLIKERMDEGLTPLKAVDNLERSVTFTDVKDRLANNALLAIKADKDAYKEFRELTKNAKGQFTAIDPSKLEYSNGSYIYDNSILIDFTNSPYSIVFRRV